MWRLKKDMFDLSILIPAIRTHNWNKLYDSAKAACKNHSFQIVFIGPFDPPEELVDDPNIKYIKEYGSVSRAVQRGMLELDSDLVFLTVDDCVFAEDSIDICLRQYNEECEYQDVLNMRYSEYNTVQNPNYYVAWNHTNLQLNGISKEWQIAPQFIMNKNHFIDLGGFDCRFEYINEPVHDFMFRLQKGDGKIVVSKVHCCIATWYPLCTGDHAPIHHAQIDHDYPIFVGMYSNFTSRYKIDYDNWKDSPEVWTRRFPEKYDSYKELATKQGYEL